MQPVMINDTEQKIAELSLLLNHISHALLFESLQNEIQFVNQNFCDLFLIPVPPEMLFGADCSKSAEQSAHLFLEPEAFVEGIRKVYSEARPVMNEELILADGRPIYRDYKPIFSQSGISGHLWIYKHSLELRSILNEVREQKNFYEHLLNNIPADIAIFNKEHKYLFLNKIAISKKETRHWLVGKDDFDFVRETNKPVYLAISRRAQFLEALQTGETVEFEEENITPAGEKVYNLRRFYPVKKDGSIENVIGYGINITKIREREERLKENELAFRDLVDSMDQLVVTINEDGLIEYANPQWSFLTGMDTAYFPGKKISSFIKTGRDSLLHQIKSFFSGNRNAVPKTQVSIIDKNGKKRVLSYYLSTFTHSVTGDKRAALYFNDITEQLIAEKRLTRIAKEERKLNELKSSFMSLVSHELRTPLSVILSSAELIELSAQMARQDHPEKTKLYTNRIIRQVDKMTQLMTEFLFLSKVEAGKIPYNPKQLDLTEFLQRLKTEMYYPWKDGRMLELSSKGKPVAVFADELMISYTITNLVNNAFKYSPGAAAPRLRLRFCKKIWEVLIADAGIGIPEDQIKRVFQPFTRGNNVGEIEGSGFGLNIVKIFVKTHKGRIRLKSRIGKGTAVLLQFPY